jgi:hypothetical protein
MPIVLRKKGLLWEDSNASSKSTTGEENRYMVEISSIFAKIKCAPFPSDTCQLIVCYI